jgi:hypothetical protein
VGKLRCAGVSDGSVCRWRVMVQAGDQEAQEGIMQREVAGIVEDEVVSHRVPTRIIDCLRI